MKNFSLLILLFPFILFSQKAVSQGNLKAYTISGTIAGLADGSTIDLLNGNTGQPENSATVNNGKFVLKGKVDYPDFKLITVNKQPKYIQLFLDNSNITLVANKDAIESADITGSATHEDFKRFLSVVKKYEAYFVPNGARDAEGVSSAIATLEGFVKDNPSSYVSPIALYKSFQLSENTSRLEELFKGLSANVRSTPIGTYISNQIAESKFNQIGQPLEDFSQDDPSGKSIKLSSFKGKYVLVDFWASWCGPCRQENPNIVNLYNKYKNKNFDVFGVSLDKSKQPWLDAIKKDQLTWPHVSDLKGWNNEVAQKFRITSIPQNFLLDPNGIIVAKNLRGEDLERKLETLLK